MIPYFSRYRVTENFSAYDIMSEHPGQIVRDVNKTTTGEATMEDVGRNEEEQSKKEKRMVLYRDCLQEIPKQKLALTLKA